jgi:hypothetical protein
MRLVGFILLQTYSGAERISVTRRKRKYGDASCYMSKKRFHIIGIGPLFEDLIIDIRAKHTYEIRYNRGVIKHLCLEAGIKEKSSKLSKIHRRLLC